jgi:hypothetical protein
MRLPYKIRVRIDVKDRPRGLSLLATYKKWMSDSLGERDKQWVCLWCGGPWYELSFNQSEDLVAFKIRFGL